MLEGSETRAEDRIVLSSAAGSRALRRDRNIFGITMQFRIGAGEMGWASVFIFVSFAVLILNILTRRDCYGDHDALARHLADFPWEKGLGVWGAEDSIVAAPRRHRV